MIGEGIKVMIIKISNECLPLSRGKIDELFNAITKIRVDPSPLQSQIEKYMESVDHLDAMQCNALILLKYLQKYKANV